MEKGEKMKSLKEELKNEIQLSLDNERDLIEESKEFENQAEKNAIFNEIALQEKYRRGLQFALKLINEKVG